MEATQVKLELLSGSKLELTTLIVPTITSPVKNLINSTVLHHDYLKALPLAQQTEVDVFCIDLLIGADYYWNIVGDEVVRGSGPTAVSSKLGYLLSGPTHLKDTSVMTTMVCKTLAMDAEQDLKLSMFWDLETIGVKDDPQNKGCDYKFYRDNCLKHENGRYTATLPWKTEHRSLPTNYEISRKRTRSMVKKTYKRHTLVIRQHHF